MKFVCDRCQTRYSLSDEKVKGKVLKIRCKTCGNILVVRETGVESAEPAAAAAAAGGGRGGAAARGPAPRTEAEFPKSNLAPPPPRTDGTEWYVAIKGQQHGPMGHSEVVKLYREGKIHDRSYCWNDGLSGWTRISELPDFRDYLGGPRPTPAAAPMPPPPPSEEGGQVVSLEAARAQRQQDAPKGAVTAEELAAAMHNDPFAAVGGVPGDGMSNETSAPRESTRVFIMNAGLHNRSQKHRVYAVIAAASFIGIIGLGYLDYAGIVRIPLLNSVVSKVVDAAGMEAPPRRRLLAEFDDAANDPEMRCKLLGDCPDPKKEGGKGRRGRRPASGGGIADLASDDAFGTGGPGDSADIERALGPDGKPIDVFGSDASKASELKALFGDSGKQMAKAEDRKEDGRTIAVAGDQLSAEQLSKVVTQNISSITTCVESAAKLGSTVGGKQKLLITIQPNGAVSNSRILNGPVNASPVGECIRKASRKWKFPPFPGAAYDVEIPIILSAN